MGLYSDTSDYREESHRWDANQKQYRTQRICFVSDSEIGPWSYLGKGSDWEACEEGFWCLVNSLYLTSVPVAQKY